MSSRPEWRDLFLTAREHEISPLRFASVEMTELEAPVISTGAPIISTEVEVISTEELRHLDRSGEISPSTPKEASSSLAVGAFNISVRLNRD